MSGSHLWIPRNETVQCAASLYFQNRIIIFCLAIPTVIYLWEIYIFPVWVFLFCCSQICGLRSWGYINCSQTHECGNWDSGRAIPRKGIHKWDFTCSTWFAHLHTHLLSVPQNLRRAVGSTNFPVVGNGLDSTTIIATCVADRVVPLYEGWVTMIFFTISCPRPCFQS